jgi:hypothetical protein
MAHGPRASCVTAVSATDHRLVTVTDGQKRYLSTYKCGLEAVIRGLR